MALQCCAGFCCTTVGISHKYTYIPASWASLPQSPHASRSALITEFPCLCYAAAPTILHMAAYTGASLVAQRVKSLPTMQETRVPPLGQKDPPEKCLYLSTTLPICLTLCFPGCVQSPVSTSASLLWACLSRFSHVGLCEILWTAVCRAPLSMGFSRQEHWSG